MQAAQQLTQKHQLASFDPEPSSKTPLETAQSEKIESPQSPIKIHLDSIGKPDAQVTQL